MKPLLLFALLFAGAHAFAQRPDLVMQDFEAKDYGAWTTEGTAFGAGPVHGPLPGQQRVSGFLGNGLANSFQGGDRTTGKLTSPPFTIERNFVSFLIGGGHRAADIYIALLVDGTIARRATGVDSEQLQWKCWDVTDLAGRTARIQLVDEATDSWGHILADQITQTDTEKGVKVTMEAPEFSAQREITIMQRYLYIPVRETSMARKVKCMVDGTAVRCGEIRLSDDGTSDFPAFMDMGQYIGRKLTVTVDRLPNDSRALASITQDNVIRDAGSIYHEKYRPQFHFSPSRGWNNDANGLVYYKGEYHMFYQYNPTGLTGAGFNMHWGHAVSTDLVHWKELPIAIYPTEIETGIYSGSAIVDWTNSSGLKTGKEAPLIAFYTSIGKSVCQFMVFSNDRGRTWTRYANNPVLPHIIGGDRDPKVTWDKETKHWIMALFLDEHDYGLFTSPDLEHWTQIQKMTVPGCSECPDFFPMPTAGHPKTWVFIAANGRYLVGDFDGTRFVFQGEPQRVEFGNNSYAGQTFSDIPARDGRRIQISWMPGEHYPDMPYSQQMSFPCTLTLHNTPAGLRLFKYPVAEIARLYSKSKVLKNISIAPGANLVNRADGDLLDIAAEVEVGNAKEFRFTVRGFSVHYDVAERRLSGPGSAELSPADGRIKLRILLDRTSMEVYGNDGEVAMTSRCLPKEDTSALEISTEGGPIKIVSMAVHELKSAW